METAKILEYLVRNKFSTQLALLSFILGTILFLTFIFSENETIFIIGFFYVIIAFILNLITLFFVIFSFFKNPKQELLNIFQIIIMLLNIPISIIYFTILFNNF